MPQHPGQADERDESGAFVVSGGTRGIGLAVCRRLLADGHRVLAAARSPADVEAAGRELPNEAFAARVLDVRDEAGVRAWVDDAARGGGLVGAVVAHGVYEHSLPALATPADAFAHTLAINVTGAFVVAREAARVLVEQGSGGVIVLLGSVNGMLAEPGSAAYNASKAAVHSLAQTLALELAADGIRVAAVAPGWIRTRMTEQFVDADVESGRRRFNPQGRVAEPAEVAELVAWLCSPAASFVTGAVVAVDGGQSAMLPPAWSGPPRPDSAGSER